MIYADQKGNIGWQAVGISPIRKNWTGLVPVAGDGRYEGAGYLAIMQLPHKINPSEGYVVTANNNLTPVDFPHRNAIGWTWANPVRAHRIEEVLNSGKRMNLQDFATLQTDYLSISARTLVPLLLNTTLQGSKEVQEARIRLNSWDYQLTPTSIAAAIYAEWETQLKLAMHTLMVPESIRPYYKTLPMNE